MVEMIDIFTEQKEKIGTISKREYYSLTCSDKDIPWIKCASCFVIDGKNKKILLEKRGEQFLDPGKIDVLSGHVQSGELPIQCVVREGGEELKIPEYYMANAYYLGTIRIDYTDLEDKKLRKRLKAEVSIFALMLKDDSIVEIDGREVKKLGAATFDETKGFFEMNVTRFPYTIKLKSQYDEIFQNLKEFMFYRKNNRMVAERIK